MPTVSQPPPLPGFGLPLGLPPRGRTVVLRGDNGEKVEIIKVRGEPLFHTLFYHDIMNWQNKRLPLLTLREIAMLEFMNTITDKSEWESKIFETHFTENWKAEVRATRARNFTPAMADHCIEELKYKAQFLQRTGAVSIFNGDVVKADNCFPANLKNDLRYAVTALENSSEIADWRPGSNGTVLDLVHPSLYPLTYGLTRIMPDSIVGLETCILKSGDGETIPVPPRIETVSGYSNRWRAEQRLYSNKFQWLPCDVDISGETPHIVSYINNLHPQRNANLYSTVEHIIEKVLPLWNQTLSPLRDFVYRRRIAVSLKDYIGDHGPGMEEGGAEHGSMGHELDFIGSTKPRPPHIPDAGVFTKPEALKNPVDLKADYGHRGIQMIVKLTSIHLPPENPRFNGEGWSVEGQFVSGTDLESDNLFTRLQNEHICASAVYYFDDENITPSRLTFRQAAETVEIERARDEPNGLDWLKKIFGCQGSESAAQQVGSIEIREDRIITFPNLLQHQVQPFELVDSTRPGHRKILELFLVDPNIRIISTANVPCQQHDWWSQAISGDVNSRLGGLPLEIYKKIIDEAGDYPISLETAKRLQADLMEERKSLSHTLDENFRRIDRAGAGGYGYWIASD